MTICTFKNFTFCSLLFCLINFCLFGTIAFYTINYIEFLDAEKNYNTTHYNNTINDTCNNTINTSDIINTTYNLHDNIFTRNNTSKTTNGYDYNYDYIMNGIYSLLYINISSISAYTLFYIMATCCIFKHFIGILIANLFYISIIVIVYINYLLDTDCKSRYLLPCNNMSMELDNTILIDSKNGMIYYIMGSILFNILYCITISIWNSKNKRYYVNNFILLETFIIFIGYYIFSLYFLLYPILCCIGFGLSKNVFITFIKGKKWPQRNFEVMA